MLDFTAQRAVPYEKLGYSGKQQADRQQYLDWTKDHRMTILQDDGVYRLIRMSKPQSSAYRFNITTFPGYLVFTGDMGSYVFSRVYDMFEFHRIDWNSGTPTIDYRYWAQKCEAQDRNSGLNEFCEATFRDAAVRAFREYEFPSTVDRMEAWRDFRQWVVEIGHCSSEEATRAGMEWSYTDPGTTTLLTNGDLACLVSHQVQPFHDFYDYGPFTRPSFRLRWACWAIAETIRAYDLGGDRFTRQASHDAKVLEGKL